MAAIRRKPARLGASALCRGTITFSFSNFDKMFTASVPNVAATDRGRATCHALELDDREAVQFAMFVARNAFRPDAPIRGGATPSELFRKFADFLEQNPDIEKFYDSDRTIRD